MLNIVCVLAGDYQGRGRQYVEVLHDMVRRNLAEGYQGRFICFTDQPLYIPGVICRDLPPGLMGWFNKLWLFSPGLFLNPGDRVLYLDLDTAITGRLDEIAAYDVPANTLAILRDPYASGASVYGSLNSSVMMWRAGDLTYLWETFLARGCPAVEGGDQVWIERHLLRVPIFLQDVFPDLFASYKTLGRAVPAKASVILFHGHPKPHEVTNGWVPEVWKVGGMIRADLDRVMNVERDRVRANVRAACRLDHPWLDKIEPHDRHVVIVGGGPSVRGEIDMIHWRHRQGQEVWAVNGASHWLATKGVFADVQVLLDARPVVGALVDPSAGRYIIASQCDPVVYDWLGRDVPVTIFHSHTDGIEEDLPDDARPVHLIGGGSTVGLQAMAIAFLQGFRFLHLYGFDSSHGGGRHHAYPQQMNDDDIEVEAVYGDRKFKAAPWMVQQAEEFMVLARFLVEEGCLITVAGDGLLPAMAHASVMPLTPAELRASAITARLPAGAKRGAEIGVFTGALSALLLQDPDLELIMVDPYEGDGASYIGDSGDFHAGLTQAQQDDAYERANEAVKFAGERAEIWLMRSVDAAMQVEDGSLDFVFIDADHSYEGCAADIAAWAPKLKPGGLLSGHDYSNDKFPMFGVNRAVDEYVAKTGLTLERGGNFTWFIRMPLVGTAQEELTEGAGLAVEEFGALIEGATPG